MIGNILLYIMLSGYFVQADVQDDFIDVTPIKEIVWWNTTGGKVIQQKDQNESSCSLILDDNSETIAITWDSNLAYMTFLKSSWNLIGSTSQVAVQIGDIWLENGNGTPNIEAQAERSAFMIPIKQQIIDLLVTSDHITTKVNNQDYSMKLNRVKMVVLLTAVNSCRKMIK